MVNFFGSFLPSVFYSSINEIEKYFKLKKYFSQLQLHFPSIYGNEKFISHLWGVIIMNPEDGSLVLLKAHGFENVTSLGKHVFEPLNATCRMSCICSR